MFNKEKKIKFISNRPWLNNTSKSVPEPIIKTIPEWYKKADRFAINPETNDPWINPQDGGKIPTWKACPAIFDVMGTGYTYKTPCDIEFYLDKNKKISVKILDKKYLDFVTPRDPMPQFHNPHGYYENHFAWYADWGIETPPGYSSLYMHPINRYELPFLSTNGIIDNDKVNLPGLYPFFVKDNWKGILPAGTPYMQIIPFKRESWTSEIVIEDPKILNEKNIKNSAKYRVKNGGVYKNQVWEKRSYK